MAATTDPVAVNPVIWTARLKAGRVVIFRASVSKTSNAVVVVEKWESLDALLGHLKAGHMVEYRQRVQDYVRGVKLMVLRPV